MTSRGHSKHHKVIIVGAGFSGLATAKTYLQIDPSVDLLIVDGDSGVGGVWSESRIYPGLEYEAPTPMMNFSDLDIRKELGLGDWADVTGNQVNEYIVRYARKFDLLRRCKLNTEVVTIERSGSRWKVLARPNGGPKDALNTLTCDKLIVATGLNSKARMPDYDMSKFNGFSFHALEMAKRHGELTADGVNHVTVIGGHKSALETVGTVAQAGKNVEWLVRKEGGGPTWMLAARAADGSSNVKMGTKRFMKIFTPSVYNSNAWINRFFHSGRWRLGTWFVAWFWGFITKTILGDRYSKSENGSKLKPHPPSFYWFTPGGTIVHDRDAETLRLVDEGKIVHVNRAHLTAATGNSITLSTGEQVKTDGVVFCTGWELTNPPLFPTPLAHELGLPVDPNALPKAEREYWATLDTPAEENIVKTYPILQKPPKEIHVPSTGLTPFRHFRAIVPPKLAANGDNSLVFLGNYATGKIQTTAEIYSLWAIAYLEGLLTPAAKALLSNKPEMDKDIAHNEAWRKKRYLCGLPVRVTIVEAAEYEAIMLKELGVRSDRHAMKIPTGLRGWFGLKGWWAEWFKGYFAEDFKGIVDEFLEDLEKRGGRGKIVDERTPLVNGVH